VNIVFVSNFLNHHQLPLCQAFINAGVDFSFVATKPLTKERINLGYENMNEVYGFVIKAYENHDNYNKGLKVCLDADVVILGSAPIEFVKQRIKTGKLTFIYTERIYKDKVRPYKLPFHFLRFMKKGYRKNNVHLLCASAFTAADFAKTFTFLNKAYKWGYFTEIKKYDDINFLIEAKKKLSLLWVGRLIDWKHPELPIEIASRLKSDGYKFNINIIGVGPMEDDIRASIENKQLEGYVRLLGSMSPQAVREHMEGSEVFLFTSNRKEGWGAVLNEAMNSSCGVVASSAIGSVPFLIKDGENGLIYEDGNIDDLYKKVKFLLDNTKVREQLGLYAYKTMVEQWNADNAAERLIELSKSIIAGNKKDNVFSEGVCSKAPLIRDNRYRRTKSQF